MNYTKLRVCLLLVLALFWRASSQTINAPEQATEAASLETLIATNTFRIDISGGKLTGEGAEIIKSALGDAQFVALGEEHNKRAVHLFAAALFRLLHADYNFNYLALEEDAHWGTMLSAAAKKGGGEAVVNLALKYPNAFHLATEDEMKMIGEIGKISAAETPIWGLNQIFGAAHIYERLARIAPHKTARETALKFLRRAEEYERERFQKNVQYIAQVAKPEDFDELRRVFNPEKNSEADFLIAQLALSNRIYAPYIADPRPAQSAFYESGKLRETNMKTLFAENYKKAAKREKLPKALFMLGQLHLYRGVAEKTGQYALGNFLSELAIYNNQKSLHIYSAVDAEYIRRGAFAALARSASEIASVSGAAGALVDLRSLSARAREDKNMTPEMRRLLTSYDFFLFLRDAESGSVKKLQTPQFRWYSN